jgi:outer membrane protein assembly factor BamB
MNVLHHATTRTARLAAICAVASAIAVPLGVTAAQAASPEWSQPGFGAGNTGYNPGESIINMSTIAKLKARWTVKPAMVSGDGCASLLRPPVVAGGRVFVAEGAGAGAYDASAGKRLWRDTTAFGDDGSPLLVVAGSLVIGVVNTCYSQSDPNGTMIAFDAKTGAVKWKAQRDAPFDTTVVDAGVVIASGGSPSDTDLVTAYRVGDGAVQWSRSEHLMGRPVVAGGRLLLNDTEVGGTVAVVAATGAELWHTAANWDVYAANPAGDRFYVTDGGKLVAVKAATGGKAWSVSAVVREITTDGRRLFVADGDAVIAYDATTGKKQWTKDLGDYVSRPIRAGGLLYAIVGEGVPMAILDPVTGAKASSGSAYKKALFNPVLVGGRLYTTDGTTLRTYTP